MSYQVLALKYRPQTFNDVVGQTHVTTTLTNAISSDRVAHAIMLTGPRGTGKTTIARILAKAMNCRQGPLPVPCNQCEICKDIIEGHCSDVFEIDGASNNSVNQIRDLRENVTYMPSSAKYKIYIIDEVHMLSTAAFNALLKTLEEPPEHVMFIFATTEVHKIPATILSRCQRHDLGRIGFSLITQHLKELCIKEGYTIEDSSLDLIAQEADGSIRDSLSLLDRVLSSAGSNSEISHDDILDSIGLLDTQIMHDLSGAVFEKNGARIIEIIEMINNSGMDLNKFYSDLILHFRHLNVIKICGEKSQSVNLSENEKQKFSNMISSLSRQYINNILQHLLDDESIVRYTSHTKTAIEMVLLKLLDIDPGEHIDQIISRLDTLAKQIGPGHDITTSSPAEAYNTLSNKHQSTSNNSSKAQQDVHEKKTAAKPETGSDTSSPSSGSGTPKTWQSFLSHIESNFPFMYALLSKGRVNDKEPDQIIVELDNCSAFDKNRIESKKGGLQKECKKFLGKNLIINICSVNPIMEQNNKKKNEKLAKQAAFNHPFVIEAKKMFNGEIINY